MCSITTSNSILLAPLIDPLCYYVFYYYIMSLIIWLLLLFVLDSQFFVCFRVITNKGLFSFVSFLELFTYIDPSFCRTCFFNLQKFFWHFIYSQSEHMNSLWFSSYDNVFVLSPFLYGTFTEYRILIDSFCFSSSALKMSFCDLLNCAILTKSALIFLCVFLYVMRPFFYSDLQNFSSSLIFSSLNMICL